MVEVGVGSARFFFSVCPFQKSFILSSFRARGAFVRLAAISASHLYFSSALNTAVRVWLPFYFLSIFIDRSSLRFLLFRKKKRSSLSRCSFIVALFDSAFLTALHILMIFSMRYIAVVAPRPCPPFHCFLRPLQGGRFLYLQCWRFIRIPTYLPTENEFSRTCRKVLQKNVVR